MGNAQNSDSLLKGLNEYNRKNKAPIWNGTLAQFISDVLPIDPKGIARTSHQWIYDMMREGLSEKTLVPAIFKDELFGVEKMLERFMDYFKAAAAGSEVGRRLLLLLGPPSGGKSSLVILMKKGMETYSHSEKGALFGIAGCPIKESPLHLIPHPMRAEFRTQYGIEITGELCPHCVKRLSSEYQGEFMKFSVERIFISEAERVGVGTYAPHDPTTADMADLVGSVDLSKVAQYGDEGDPRAWSWSGAVYAGSRGMLEMIEILKVKREFLYLLLTLTQEKNVKVARFPLIHIDETILAHTNLAEFRKFLQEPENEALLDRMVIIQVPYTLSFKEEAKIYKKLVSSAPAFRSVHLDPHALNVAAVFAVLTRMQKGDNGNEAENLKKIRLFAGEDVEGVTQTEVEKLREKYSEEGMAGISPRFVINALSNAIIQSEAKSLTAMDVLVCVKNAIDHDVRMEEKKKREWIDFLVTIRKDFYNRWVKNDVHKALFVSFQQEAQELLEKYLDEVEAVLENRTIIDRMTKEERRPDERFLRKVEEKIRISESGKLSFRQEVVRKAMSTYKVGAKFTLDNHAALHDAIETYLFDERRDVLRLVSSSARPDDEAKKKISAVEERLIKDYGYDIHSAREALSYVTTLLAQE